MESQLNKNKLNPVQLAEQAMKDMKARIDLLKSHKATINTLVQVAGNKPLFLIREIESEEALIRQNRTQLNLWIQSQVSKRTFTDPFSGYFCASREAQRIMNESENTQAEPVLEEPRRDHRELNAEDLDAIDLALSMWEASMITR